MDRLEGAGVSKLAQVIRSLGYNKDVDIIFGTIKAEPPDIKISLDNFEFELDKDDVYFVESLLPRKVKLKAQLRSDSVSSSMSTAGYTPHTHDISKMDIDGKLEVEYTQEDNGLKVGDRVILIDYGQAYLVLDKVVKL
jgi:hypothetical protein